PMTPGPNGRGLSRKHILSAIDASLRRLELDYVDLYQIHRWDSETPIEETMEALDEVVKSGKARYIGASSMFAWQFAKAQRVVEFAGERGVPPAQVALAWLLHKPGVTAPIVGATKLATSRTRLPPRSWPSRPTRSRGWSSRACRTRCSGTAPS